MMKFHWLQKGGGDQVTAYVLLPLLARKCRRLEMILSSSRPLSDFDTSTVTSTWFIIAGPASLTGSLILGLTGVSFSDSNVNARLDLAVQLHQFFAVASVRIRLQSQREVSRGLSIPFGIKWSLFVQLHPPLLHHGNLVLGDGLCGPITSWKVVCFGISSFTMCCCPVRLSQY